jgi:predicted permease
MALSLFATLLVALAPLRFGFGKHDALREAGVRTTGSRVTQRVRRTLIAAEVALSIVLLAGAGLLLRSFANMIGVDPGFRTERRLTVTVLAPPSSYPDDAVRRTFFARLVTDASAIPGVEAAGAVVNLPLAAGVGDLDIELPGQAVAAGDVAPRLDWQVVTPGYFDAMGIQLVRGRAITNVDDARAPGAVVLSESAVGKYWGDSDPIGQRFKLGAEAGPGWVTIVGVVRDVRQNALTLEPPALMYLPHAQFRFWHGGNAPATMTLVLHAAREPMTLLSPLREVMRRIDPHVPLSNVRTMEQVVSTALAQPRFATSVLGGFALLALVLAVIGVYGLVAYSVARRTREIAVRMALGAAAHNVVGQIVLQGLRPVFVGAIFGVVGAVLLTSMLDTMLYGVAPRDPVTLAGTVLVLACTAVVAAVLPARHAARVTPMGALREE